MPTKIKLIALFIATLVFLAIPTKTMAQADDSTGPNAELLCGETSIQTAIGCIPFGSTGTLQNFILTWGLGLAGGISIIIIIIAGYQMMTSQGDPKRLQNGRDLLYAAITGIALLIFAALLIRIIAVDILNILPYAFG